MIVTTKKICVEGPYTVYRKVLDNKRTLYSLKVGRKVIMKDVVFGDLPSTLKEPTAKAIHAGA